MSIFKSPKKLFLLLILLSLFLIPTLTSCVKKNTSKSIIGEKRREETKKPRVIEFYASWWPACRKMAPVVNRLQKEFSEKVDFLLLNVDEKESEKEATQYGIQYIPTFIFLDNNGREVDKVIGEISEAELRKKIENLLR